jgi:hypothetical protein
MNIPNRASRHQAMWSARCAGVSFSVQNAGRQIITGRMQSVFFMVRFVILPQRILLEQWNLVQGWPTPLV